MVKNNKERKVHNIFCCRRCRRHRLQRSGVAALLDSLILLRFVVVSVVLVPHVVLLGSRVVGRRRI